MLENWLSKIDNSIITSSVRKDHENVYNHIETYIKKIPNLNKIDVAIIGVHPQLSNEIRQSFYKLKYNFVNTNIIDLGNIKKNNLNFIIPVIKELLDNKIFPLLIGASTNLFYAMYQAYQSKSHQINAGIISNHFEYGDNPNEFNINDFISIENHHLFTMTGIGIQGHLLSSKTTQIFKNRHFPLLHLGELLKDITLAEPTLRDLDVLAFDMSAIKSAYMPGAFTPSANGLNENEACRLAYFAGLSDKLTSFSLLGINYLKDINNQSINLATQVLWYFLEGFNTRVGDFPKSIKNLAKYKLPKKTLGTAYNFYMSNQTGRWWVELPWLDKMKSKRHFLIPCGPEEYKNACVGIEPISITKAQARFEVNLK